ncbi:EAL domain-containing protein [Psychrobium sp. 1_MG-2023]|uniref:EAL domain-containing protein n=1 Tax=Psychrobium sp. 1_MG-2023 TaxID=3062624 RepID=UPI000C33DBDE|nr:EAL domain-containing protein [Psychrobium sp. 1_MG-2023]MDP2562276.1 EAL domain-containing protein [Psychrobium sp. 1_MG-2023]PKF54659.1 histidine kinase [Alteromonadales bacterium alter-6D02]
MNENSLCSVVERNVVTCFKETSLREATGLMHQRRCSSIIVTENHKPIGIWTEADSLSVDLNNPDALGVPLGEVMSVNLFMVNIHLSLDDVALELKLREVRHLIVIDDDGLLVGVVSQSDIIINQDAQYFLSLTQVQNIMPKKQAPLLDASKPIHDAIELMRKRRSDSLVATIDDQPAGLLTERDIVRLIATNQLDTSIESVMSQPLISVSNSMSLLSIRSFMQKRHIRHLGVQGDNGEFLGIVSFSDILNRIERSYINRLRSALAETSASLKEKEYNLHMAHALIEASVDGIMVTDRNTIIKTVNPAFTQVTGYSEAEALGQPASMVSSGRHDKEFYDVMWQTLDEEGYWQGEVWNRKKNGEIYPEWLTITRIVEPTTQQVLYAGIFNDISDRKNSELIIEHLAYYDPLTKLPNRQLLFDRIDNALTHAHEEQSQLGLLFIDLDHFKRINESLGHDIGDLVLCEVANRLNQCISHNDTLARVGGDELVIVLSELEDKAVAYRTAQQVIECFETPLIIDDKKLFITSSVGCSIFPQDGLTRTELLRNSDSAMHRAKEKGRNQFCLYSSEMNKESQMQLALEQRLRAALINNEFFLEYQPKVDVKSRKVVGVEALLRWQDKILGRVAPDVFIPLAEELGLISDIGFWVLKQSICQGLAWKEQGLPPLRISVNISVKQFANHNLVSQLAELIECYDYDPSLLDIEVTETSFIEDAEYVFRCLDVIRQLGVSVSMDDFGTGYSSLSLLTKMPLDQLKVDRSFMEGIPGCKDNEELVSTIILMAHNLNLTVVAEGVETEEQLMFLQNLNCEEIQGYYFSRPVSAKNLTHLVA